MVVACPQTLVDMVGGTPPSYLDGHSLMPLLAPAHPRSVAAAAALAEGTAKARPDFITAQCEQQQRLPQPSSQRGRRDGHTPLLPTDHSNMGNTGSFMIRQGDCAHLAQLPPSVVLAILWCPAVVCPSRLGCNCCREVHCVRHGLEGLRGVQAAALQRQRTLTLTLSCPRMATLFPSAH